MKTLSGFVAADKEAFSRVFTNLMETSGLGWARLAKEAGVSSSQISTWKNGEGVPELRNVEAISDTLHLTPIQRHYLRGLAGYVAPTIMPPANEIVFYLDRYVDYIRDYEFPAYIDDYRFTYWACNSAAAVIVGGDIERLRELGYSGLTGIDITFDPRLGVIDRVVNREDLQRDQLLWLMTWNVMRRHEPWFRAYPACMETRLENSDTYDTFRYAWDEVTAAVEEPVPLLAYSRQGVHLVVELPRHSGDTEPLVFRVVEIRVNFMSLAGSDLFTLVRYEPAPDLERVPRGGSHGDDKIAPYRAFFRDHAPTDRTPVRLWDGGSMGRARVEQRLASYGPGGS